MLVDSHCHLNFPDFKDKLADVIDNAAKNDVNFMQTICTKISEFDDVLAIANGNKNIFCSVGVHPNNVAEEEIVNLQKLVELTEHNKVIGIGETGLDYYYENSPKQMQQESFKIHISAARETKLPTIIHTRAADEDTINILKDEMKKGEFPGLIHCFTSTERLALACIDLGMYISISGIVTFKNAEDIRNTVKKIPLDRLLVETDAPYLAPVPHRGKTNEPAFTKNTAEFLADFLNISYDELAQKTTDNFFRLFSKAKSI